MNSSAALLEPLPLTHARFAAALGSVEVAQDIAAVEAPWRALERGGIASPYQRFDWVAAYVEAHRGSGACEWRCVLVKDAAGDPLLLLPLAVRRTPAGRIADVIGAKHANFHLPLMRPGLGATLAARDLRPLLADAGRRLGIDAYAFTNVPLAWAGEPNPLAEGGQPSPSDGYKLSLTRDADATLARALSKDARHKLRKKAKHLANLGEVEHLIARTTAEADRFLDVFFRLKAERFRELGVTDAFAAPEMRGFLRGAATAGLAAAAPAMELHALTVGERVVAVFGGAGDPRRLSGMIIAFDPDPQIARCSPGDLLLSYIVRAQCAAGRDTFDLGVGEARYKASLCDEVETLVDVAFPVSWRGAVHAAAGGVFGAAKRRVKQTPWMWQAVGALRRVKARAGAGRG